MPNPKVLLAKSKNNFAVWYNPISSHAATHIKDTPNLASLAKKVIRQTELHKPYEQFHANLGQEVGLSDLVKTEQNDEIIYAKRLNRDSYTVFNKSRSPQPSTLVTVALQKQTDGSYELVSTWIGPSDSPSFPGTEKETPESKAFWAENSLAWGSQEIQPGTITTQCPW